MTQPVTKDFYKADVYRFDIEQNGDYYYVDVSNVISWDIIRLKLTKDELSGLGDFIKHFVENK